MVGRRVLVSLVNAAGSAVATTGRLNAAVACHRWAARLAADHASLVAVQALTYNRLGVAAKTAGRYDEARDAYARAVALMDTAPASAVPIQFAAALAHNLAGLALACGDPVEAEQHAREAVAARRAAGAPAVVVAGDAVVLGETISAQRRDDEARELFVAALRTYEAVHGPRHYEVGVTLLHLGALEQRHDAQLALEHYERALAIKMHARGPRHPEVGIVHNNIGALHRAQGRNDLARSHFTIALDLLTRRYGADHPATRTCRANLERLSADPIA